MHPLRFPMLASFAVLLAVPALARSQTTDESRALSGKSLPADEARRPLSPGTIVQTTDDARALAGRTLPRSEPAPVRTIQAVGSTDEARAVAGGLIVVAPTARPDRIARCDGASGCEQRG